MFTDEPVYEEEHHTAPELTQKQKAASPRQSVPPEEKLRELDGLVLTSGVNDLGFEDSEDESVRASRESRDSWRDESFDVDARHDDWKIEEEEKEDIQSVDKKGSKERAKERFQRDKSGSTVAMLGHFSVETKGDALPILPDAEEATGIATIDNVNDFSPEDHHASPHRASGQVRPSDMSSAAPSSMVSSLNSSMNNTDAPRPSVRVTMDSTAPIMKSHPIGTLHEMCAKGNLRGVVQHLRVDGPEALLNREPNHGQTGLHLAVKSGKVPLVKVILEQYKPLEDIINVEDDKGNTALHFAATKTPAMVHLLLENGASANVKNSRKFTPLIISVITSKDDSVIIPRMLLKFGANPNDMHDSQTVIHTAISTGRLQIAGALVRAGAKMDVEDAEGKSVFEKLPRKDLRYLISHIYFPPTYITRKERSECMLCRQKFKFEMVKFPMGFPGRTRRGAANREQKRVCKTCFNVFKERNDEPEKSDMSKFINRVINIEWDEVNPEKLQKTQEAGRRGENGDDHANVSGDFLALPPQRPTELTRDIRCIDEQLDYVTLHIVNPGLDSTNNMAPNTNSSGDVCVEDARTSLTLDSFDVGAILSPRGNSKHNPEDVVIFFDWDDTLMASSAIAKLGLCPKYINEEPEIPDDVQA
ncbi:Myosin-like protein, partial [Phytophthora palmivora]